MVYWLEHSPLVWLEHSGGRGSKYPNKFWAFAANIQSKRVNLGVITNFFTVRPDERNAGPGDKN